VAQSLDTTLTMFKSRLDHVAVQREYDPELPLISAYGSELNQVWTELIANALDAMQDAGRLVLKTRAFGDSIAVEIQNDGPGIPPEIVSRIFEPFFTTKPPGQGLGLGLDSVNRILSKHNGSISVESTPASTCFQVRLPIERAEAY
jgi:signal transduction histidine kinase